MKKFTSILSLILAFLLAIVVIRVFLLVDDTKFDEVGLGEGTSKYLPKKNNLLIHADQLKGLPQIDSNINFFSRNRETVLWLGNSQLHGINQYKREDKNSVEYLHDLLSHKEKFVIGFSLPNANLQEHYVLFRYFSDRFPVKQLILPVFFDDTREDGVRGEIITNEVATVLKRTSDTSLVGKLIENYFLQNEEKADNNEDNKALRATTQENVEKYLNTKMDNFSGIWASRAELRSILIYNYLFGIRNTVLQIDPDTKRKKIPARYQTNINALKRIGALCNEKSIQLLVYIPPIRSDVEQPYVLNEYEEFKNDLKQLAKEYHFQLLNTESIIPKQFWGMKGSTRMGEEKLEIDFMHFKDQGHKILADTIAYNSFK